MTDWPIVLENDDGIRPAGKPDECFYCRQKVGQPHKRTCVTIDKLVRVKYTFEIEIAVPHYWGKKEFENHRNQSHWCADNAFGEIERFVGDSCACDCFKAEYIEDVDTTPQQNIRKDSK